ncbi:AlpA family phage regulatory protein [Peteryoungia desertarenae]|uniref:AlpA family phage regulatory protein n=1 Tax=Peteryoungia desertarenae TaxID=1813451 RepID=A0ABX6QJ08_9HYPH|nr:AlpA family phage regulatory protein [Peteryoungia desertarenae]QLF68326.1 AlpA family phage regulatory protein [Peteryoungia desertarenae]
MPSKKSNLNSKSPLISLNDACELTSLSRTAINTLRSAGRFPAALQISDKRIAFVRTEVEAWIEARISARARRAELA